MKIFIKNEQGVEREINPDNVIVSGKPLVYHLDELNSIKMELKELKRVYTEDVKELMELWKNLNLL